MPEDEMCSVKSMNHNHHCQAGPGPDVFSVRIDRKEQGESEGTAH